ncbi:MAG TPA: glycosyltransferase family 39 protein [Gemmataceae bacterium]|nr:glycosyltransferase family 39 protein [Gemmataceae bacterium]
MLAAATRRFLIRSILSHATALQPRFWPKTHVYGVLAATLILTSSVAHIAYIASPNALDLAPDEAHYWLWSQDLDASYYSKGPLIAWLIRGSTELLGDWSRSHFGSEVFAIRFPAAVCGGLLLLSIYVLTARCFRDERLALLVLLFALTIPVLSAGQTIMTIDAPFTCCWGWALVLGHRALYCNSGRTWLALGLIVGVGMLAKFTMVLWPISFALFLLASSHHRRSLRTRNFWLMMLVAASCCLPMLWWNWNHEWVSLRHLERHAGINEPTGIQWLGPLKYVAGQLGLLMGFWFVVWAVGMIRWRPAIFTPSPPASGGEGWGEGGERPPIASLSSPHPHSLSPEAGERGAGPYLWFLSAPVFLWFAAFSLITDVQLNWPVTAYLSGMVLAGAWLYRHCSEGSRFKRRLLVGSAVCFGILGLAMSVLMRDSSLVRPMLAHLAGKPAADNPTPLRQIDPTCRMRGWHELGRQVDAIRANLRLEGIEPVIAASRWNYTSELAFYCNGHPPVYSLGSALWDRHSQFDIWRPNPIADAEQFRGRTFIYLDVGGRPPDIEKAFERVEPSRRIWYEENGQPIAFWDVTVCRGYKGMKASNKGKY